jgi:leucyl/phenylalanyl-tRNA---protein transferase
LRPTRPQEPAQTNWAFPTIEFISRFPDGAEVVAEGADISPGSLLAGYRRGIFGMFDGPRLLWWSPDPRGILVPSDVHVSRSMRPVLRRLELSLDHDFPAVLNGCADPRREHGWITADYARSYLELHRLGWAHSIEVWEGLELVGGLIGIELGGLFAGESMFHTARVGAPASRAAVIGLSELLAGPGRLIDVQWCTPHLAAIGVAEMARTEYLARLPGLLSREPRLTGPAPWATVHPPSGPTSRIRWRNA